MKQASAPVGDVANRRSNRRQVLTVNASSRNAGCLHAGDQARGQQGSDELFAFAAQSEAPQARPRRTL